MSQQSDIQWTDATWNPVRGCVKVSPGCAHCYAETFAERFRGVKGHPYEQGFDLRLVPEKLAEPLKWKKPRRVFVNSMSDLFQDGVPDQFIHDVYHVMEQARWHVFQVLTKRAERMRDYLSWRYGPREDGGGHRIPSRHIWHGVSVENQHFADERIPFLCQTPAAVRFISAEPLLEAIDLTSVPPTYDNHPLEGWLDWVIVGGESGPGARPFDLAWARHVVAQCQAAQVPVFVKQLGRYPFERRATPPDPDFDQGGWTKITSRGGTFWSRGGKFKDGKGGDMAEWPEDLRVRQFPSGPGSRDQ